MNFELQVQIASVGADYQISLDLDRIEYLGEGQTKLITYDLSKCQIKDVQHSHKFRFKGVLIAEQEEYVDLCFKCFGKDYYDPVIEFKTSDYYLSYTQSKFQNVEKSWDFETDLYLESCKHSSKWLEYMLPRLFKGGERNE